MSWFLDLFKKKTPVTKTWIGTVYAQFTWTGMLMQDGTFDNMVDTFYYHLYVDTNGTRSYQLTGRSTMKSYLIHDRYSISIKPWIDCGDDDLICNILIRHNKDYWDREIEPENVSNVEEDEKPKFTLLKFENKAKEDETKDPK